ncbi:MAG: sensor domain-containing diguanylate cyclase [Oscillospiraceae bacterium]|nr:sensor domain-containing diguanylate cyclase [Oscillospiraceae bacterium]
MDNSVILSEIYKVSSELYEDMVDRMPDKGHTKIFSYLTRLGKVLVNADRASFWKWDKKAHVLWTTSATDADTIVIPDNKGLVAKALRNGDLLMTNDPYSDPDFNPEVDKKTGYVTRSVLTMPISNIKGEYIGAYQVINKLDEGGFTKEDSQKLSLAAVICGLALESDVFLDESYTDKLTGLKNRMGFYSDLGWKYDPFIKDKSRTLSLFICDIDHFKSVNDTFGHNTGDEVLKVMADILSDSCDTGCGVYRWGGEEFIMIMPDADAEQCAQKAELVRMRAENTICKVGDAEIRFTVSFGITEYNKNRTVADNIGAADKNLYIAKETGRNRVVS